MNKLLIPFIFIITLAGCSSKDKNTLTEQPVARVYDEYLYKSSFTDIFPPNISHSDSIALTKNYINDWIKNQVMAHKAKEEISDEELKLIEGLVQRYRDKLLTHQYSKKLIDNAGVIEASEYDVTSLYKMNEDDYILPESIMKVHYIILSSDNYKPASFFQNRFNSDDPQKTEQLLTYCNSYASTYSFDDNWYTMSEFNRTIPSNLQIRESKISEEGKTFLDARNNNFRLIVNVNAFVPANNIAPIEYVYDNIKSTIINKKKNAIIENAENKIYNEALNNNAIEIYR